MYAVIETGGKQYRVELGTELAVERLDATPGTHDQSRARARSSLTATNAQIGTPTVADALVTADVLRQDRGEKLIVFKYRPKARHRSKNGHRQELTILRVADIRFSGRSAADEAGAAQKEKQAERKQAKKDADKKAAADQALAAKLAAETKAEEAEGNRSRPPRPSTKKAAAAKPKAADNCQGRGAARRRQPSRSRPRPRRPRRLPRNQQLKRSPRRVARKTTPSARRRTSRDRWHTRRPVRARRTVATAPANASASRPATGRSSRPARSSSASEA